MLRFGRAELRLIIAVVGSRPKTYYQGFDANEARLRMGVVAYNILRIIRKFYLWGEPGKRPMEWLILRFIKVGAGLICHAGRRRVHVASAFPLKRDYRAVLDWQHYGACLRKGVEEIR